MLRRSRIQVAAVFKFFMTKSALEIQPSMARTTAFTSTQIINKLLVTAVAAFLTGTIGCSGGTDGPELGLVSGTVTLDGTPLSGIAVSFVPDDGRPAMGKTDSDGHYQLTYIRDTLGCKVGHCRVQIGNTEETIDQFAEELGVEPLLEGDDLVQEPSPQKSTKPKDGQIPSRYNTQTELEADVKAGENTFDFTLTSSK